MDTIPRLPRPRRRELLRLGRKSRDASTYLRFLMVYKLTGGASRQATARQLDVAPSTVVRTATRYREDGVAGLYDRRRSNGSRKVDDIFEQNLGAVLCLTPDELGWQRNTWTREVLCREMRRRGFPLVAVCTMGRALAAVGARLGRPRPVVMCPWPAADRDARIAELRALVAGATRREPVFYSDEVDIHLNPKIGRDWMLRGMQRLVVTPGQNEKRYLAGALDATTGAVTWVVGRRKTSELFCQLLWRLVAAHRSARRIHIILDNYIIHSSRITRRCVESFNGRVVLHFLPPYCPNHNRIERLWLDLHAQVTRNHRCPTMGRLMQKVHAFLRRRNRHKARPRAHVAVAA